MYMSITVTLSHIQTARHVYFLLYIHRAAHCARCALRFSLCNRNHSRVRHYPAKSTAILLRISLTSAHHNNFSFVSSIARSLQSLYSYATSLKQHTYVAYDEVKRTRRKKKHRLYYTIESRMETHGPRHRK